jgi:hypothetical protein
MNRVTQLTKVANGSILLPPQVRKSWREADIYVSASDDTIVAKRLFKSGDLFNADTVKKLRRLGRKITRRDLEAAVTWARTRASA